MRCPVCNTRYMNVLQTKREPNEIIRIRQCYNEHKFETKEIVTRVVPKGSGSWQRKNSVEPLVAVHPSNGDGAETTQPPTT